MSLLITRPENRVIPVAQSIEELFHQLNINATIIDKYTGGLSHVGTINPRVKGFKTRHMEYTIKVWRSEFDARHQTRKSGIFIRENPELGLITYNPFSGLFYACASKDRE